jgi:hypothetical protein
MSKYTPEELRNMAQSVLNAERAGDGRVGFLLLALSAVTGLSPLACAREIQQLAQTEQETTENEQQPTN